MSKAVLKCVHIPLTHLLSRQLSCSDGADHTRCRGTTERHLDLVESVPGLRHSGAESVAAGKSELHCSYWEGKATMQNNTSPVVLWI